ncbi:MAG TPA: hypothetical protein VMU72_02030 [Gaiellaceae bacterium]|nr:hypothetical protein [Gaiellaceae bacterium]
MRNPFASESTAFHFLVLTVVAFGIVAAASASGGPVAAGVTWAAVSAGAVALYSRGRLRPAPELVAHVGPPDERRIVVVAPVAASPLHRLANDVDHEEHEARQRAETVARALEAPHVRVASVVGDDALAAVDDALHTFGGDEIVVLSGDDSLVQQLRERYALPVAEFDAY